MARIELRGVEVSYPVFQAGRQESLVSNIAHRASFGVLGGKSMMAPEVLALRGISFVLKDGDRLGIIGRNGSGKTTLLKTLAGLNWPQRGMIKVEGHVRSIISMGAGLEGERTGFDNIDFVCKLFGLSSTEREAVTKDVAEFTELGEFLNLPTRTYSSGMMVRLSYAIATALPGDILVVDEVLGAGDAIFQQRAAERTRARYNDAKIFVMATHSGSALSEYCTHAVWLDRGQIIDQGDPKSLWARYVAQEPLDPTKRPSPE